MVEIVDTESHINPGEQLRGLAERVRELEAIEALLSRTSKRLCIAQRGSAVLDAALDAVSHASSIPIDPPQLEQALSKLTDAVKTADHSPTEAADSQLQQALTELARILHRSNSEEASELVRAAHQELAKLQHALDPVLVLSELFDRLALETTENSDTNALKTKLLDGIDARDWPRFLERVADIVNNALTKTRRERHELENFIEQITQQLQQISDYIILNQATAETSKASTEDLEQQIVNQVDTIRDAFADKHDLKQLKQFVWSHLKHIQEQVQNYRRSELDRLLQTKDQSKQLQARVAGLENEAAALRNQLRDHRVQLLTDTLTGVFSRLAYDERIQLELTRSKRTGQAFCYAIWDVDHFKRINDSYGHQAGDRVLRMIGQLLRGKIRDSDFLCRIGGEEFVLLLTDTVINDAQILCGKICHTIYNSGFNYQGNAVSITISCGLTQVKAKDDKDTIYDRADQALLQAKAQGRNRYVVG